MTKIPDDGVTAMPENIWLQATAPASLRTAFGKVHANGGAAGGDGITSQDYQPSMRTNIAQLSANVRQGIHTFGQCRMVLLPKKKGGFRRLMIPTLDDRILHTSMANMLTPILEPLFEDSSFAYRPGRSVSMAVTAIERWRNEGCRHVIEADINNYFDSINHGELLRVLEASLKIHPGHAQILDYFRDNLAEQALQLETPAHGLVQGSPVSPLLANLYLDVLDEKMHHKGVRIVRFADDFVLLCKSLDRAHETLDMLTVFLSELGLSLNVQKTRIVDFEKGFEFLGYLFVRSLAMSTKSAEKRITETPAKKLQKLKAMQHIGVPIPPSKAILGNEPKKVRYSTGDRVLYVMERDRNLSYSQHILQVTTRENNEIIGLHTKNVDRVVIGPHVNFTRELLDGCLGDNVQLSVVNGRGETLGKLVGIEDRSGGLQFAQAMCVGNPKQAAILSRKVINARIRNERTQLSRINRHHEHINIKATLTQLKRYLKKLEYANTVEQIRGLEGASASEYWPVLALHCKGASQPFKRSRPAKDSLNATINYLTAMLERDIRSAIRAAGLHCGFGFLHTPRNNNEAAVYDLMEPFRAPLTEGLAVFLFNSNRLKVDMFKVETTGYVRINSYARKGIITGYQQALSRSVKITGGNKKLRWRQVMKRQAQDLAKSYRLEDLDHFQPYLMEA